MKNLLIIALVLMVVMGWGQTITPNLQLILPPIGTPNWGNTINGDLNLIDLAVGALQNPFQGAWSGGAIYGKGQEVTIAGGLYISRIANNLGNNPVSSP